MKNIVKLSLLSVLFAFSFHSYADLSSQLEAVAAAEAQGRKAEQRAAEQAKARARALAAEKRKEKERAYQDYMDDKKRDQAYEDELRKLELEALKLDLVKKKTRVNREDDFIDQELKRSAARTDVIQSEADATRSLSRGTETLLIKEGEARVKKESGFFK